MRMALRAWTPALAAIVFSVAACGTAGPDTAPAAAPSTSGTTPTPASTSTPAETPGGPTTDAVTTTSPSTTAESPPTSTTLPGEPWEHPYVREGTVLDVVGIAYDERLAVRSLPGDGQPLVAELPPLTAGVVATGAARLLTEPAQTYLEVIADGIVGWAPSRNLLFVTDARNETDRIVGEFGQRPHAGSMLELAQLIVDEETPDPESATRTVVVVTEPSSGTTSSVVLEQYLGEDFGDDSVAGARYVVTGRQVPAASIPSTAMRASTVFELVSVEVAGICWRGISDGLCI